MDLHLDESIVLSYKSNSQKIRVISEKWFDKNMYCPNCGNPKIQRTGNNKPVADFQCNNCDQIFELKSKKGNLGAKIADGAHSTMIERITSASNPDLFLLQYSEKYDITDLTLIPKFFFVPDIIEKRKQLALTARRAGWVGCNILLCGIPEQCKISVIVKQRIQNRQDVISSYNRTKRLKIDCIDNRGWLLDVLNCVESIDKKEFCLKDVYAFTEKLQKKHIYNKNVEAKIRQQLQFIRDKGFIEFLGKGQYRKLF